MDHKDSIIQTKQSFEASFEASSFYNKQTRDENHLEKILSLLPIKSKMKILDLGTGTGFLAFPLAQKYVTTTIIGLDIVDKALNQNAQKAKSLDLNNLFFINYDGETFPFDDNSFDMIITRYALHHFPAIEDTFSEINRVLKNDGIFFLSDPAPNDNDTERFVDEYMQMKKDGHIKFYTKQEWLDLGIKFNLHYKDGLKTSIRFPKKKETALEFNDIISRHKKHIVKGYEIEITDDEIWITEMVNNLLFQKITTT